MDLSTYVESVRAGVQNAAALADDHTKQVAEHLGHAVESSSRLALLQAISDAAAEISTELAPGSVEVRMSGTEPTFVVSNPSTGHDDVTMLMPEADEDSTEPVTVDSLNDADEAQARISLRLPQSVKEKVDEYADADGVSTNTWLLHRVLEALAERANPGRGRRDSWGINIGNDGVRFNMPGSPVPPVPPAPPTAPFPPGFPFGDQGPRFEFNRGDRGRRDKGDKRRGSVQGWVR